MHLSQFAIYIFVACTCYLLGSIPTSFLAGKLCANLDIRTMGSRNIGSSNLMINGGKIIGIMAGGLDCLIKGTSTIIFLDIYLGVTPNVLLVGLITLIIGHNWSLFMGFKGGRGIATAYGTLLGLQMWEQLLLMTLFFGVLGRLYVYKDSAVWCLGAIVSLPLLCFVFGEGKHIIIYSLLLGCLLISKRLISNYDAIPRGSVKSTLINRFIFDRDISSKNYWIRRGPG